MKRYEKRNYIFFFQLPWLPEASFRARRFVLLRRVLRTEPIRLGSFSPSDIEQYVAAAAQPGALTAPINYYRALLRQSPAHMLRRLRPIAAPTLVIWGERDRYLGPELAEPTRSWVPDLRVERLANASHWVQNDRPERVNRLLLDFLCGA
jgi:epoxide hydrolase 4